MTIASLPMYDFPEIREATDNFWLAIAKPMGVHSPLLRGSDHQAPWLSSDLAFSQTCGFPLTHTLAGRVHYVATPIYAADGCDGADYCSLIFSHKQDSLSSFEGKAAAVNTTDSMSGMLALRLFFAGVAKSQRFFGSTVLTGSHVASLEAVAEGRADVAAIDCVTVALLKLHRPKIFDGIVEIGRSPPVPALPFITKLFSAEKIRSRLRDVISDPAMKETLQILLLKDIAVLPDHAYDVIPQLEMRLQAEGNLVQLF